MIKILESNGKVDYNKYKRLIKTIVSDIMAGDNAQLIDNIKYIFKKYGGSVHIKKVSPTYFDYNGKVLSSFKNGDSTYGDYTLSGSINLSNLKQGVTTLAEDIAYVQYLNDGGKKVSIPEFIDLVY